MFPWVIEIHKVCITAKNLTLFLDENCQTTDTDPLRVHAGSTLLALDLNPQQQLDMSPQNTMELLLGDISYSNIVMVLNNGTPEEALMIDQDTNFPNYDSPVDLPLFPACFYLDVNKDGWKDLIISPNGNNISELLNVFKEIPIQKNKPTVIIAKTTKGSGVSFIENQINWHHKVPSKDEYESAISELNEKLNSYE